MVYLQNSAFCGLCDSVCDLTSCMFRAHGAGNVTDWEKKKLRKAEDSKSHPHRWPTTRPLTTF